MRPKYIIYILKWISDNVFVICIYIYRKAISTKKSCAATSLPSSNMSKQILVNEKIIRLNFELDYIYTITHVFVYIRGIPLASPCHVFFVIQHLNHVNKFITNHIDDVMLVFLLFLFNMRCFITRYRLARELLLWIPCMQLYMYKYTW